MVKKKTKKSSGEYTPLKTLKDEKLVRYKELLGKRKERAAESRLKRFEKVSTRGGRIRDAASRKLRGVHGNIARGSKKRTGARARGTRNILTALGASPGSASGGGAGRPKGSYKYTIQGKPVSVFAYRKYMIQRRQQLAQFQGQQNQRLAQRGFQPEQIQQLRQKHIVQRVQQGKPVMENNVADQELAFREHLARTTVSPRTQQIMVALRRTQNKSKSDDNEQQRRHHERSIVSGAMNLMKAHENMVKVKLDMTGVDDQQNILMAPSVFKEDGTNNNILRTDRFNLMQTREAGNNLKFF